MGVLIFTTVTAASARSVLLYISFNANVLGCIVGPAGVVFDKGMEEGVPEGRLGVLIFTTAASASSVHFF